MPWAAFDKRAFGLGDGAYGNRPRLVVPCRKAEGNLSHPASVYNAAHSNFRAQAGFPPKWGGVGS